MLNHDHDADDEDQKDPTPLGCYKLMTAQIVTGPYVVRAEVVLIVTVSLMRVVRLELVVKVGLEGVGMVGDTDETKKVEAKVAIRVRGRGRGGRCGL